MPAVRTAKPKAVPLSRPKASTKPAPTADRVAAVVSRSPESITYPLGVDRKGMRVTAFQWTVYDVVKEVPKGRITTYAAVARALNTSPRAVGNALKTNPFCPLVPCHRVVMANGRLCGFFGASHGHPLDVKAKLLESEGVPIRREGEGWVVGKEAMGRVWTKGGK